jgi:hypothetical protein
MGKVLTVVEVLGCAGIGAWAGACVGWFVSDMDNAIEVIPMCGIAGAVIGTIGGVVIFT